MKTEHYFSTAEESNAEMINGYQQHFNSTQQRHGVKGAPPSDGVGGWGSGGSSITSISKKVNSGFHFVRFGEHSIDALNVV